MPPDQDPESSVTLLARARAGDRGAVERLCERHRPALRRCARGRLPQWARGEVDTDDLVQDTLIQAVGRIGAFEPRHDGAFQAYLRQALQSRIRDEIRRHQREPGRVALDAETVTGAPSPLQQAVGMQNLERYELALARLNVGVILYEIVSGTLPYDLSRTAFPEAVRVITDEPPRAITATWSGARRLDPEIATIVGKALEKEPSRRYSTAQALAEDVQRYLTDQPIQARRPSAVYQFRKLVARHKLPFAFALVLFVVLTDSTVGLAVQARPIAHERDRAGQQAETADRVSELLVSLFRVSDPGESRGNTITAREILDVGSERISRELKDQPVVRARSRCCRRVCGLVKNRSGRKIRTWRSATTVLPIH